jgi:hypothetical protein
VTGKIDGNGIVFRNSTVLTQNRIVLTEGNIVGAPKDTDEHCTILLIAEGQFTEIDLVLAQQIHDLGIGQLLGALNPAAPLERTGDLLDGTGVRPEQVQQQPERAVCLHEL